MIRIIVYWDLFWGPLFFRELPFLFEIQEAVALTVARYSGPSGTQIEGEAVSLDPPPTFY